MYNIESGVYDKLWTLGDDDDVSVGLSVVTNGPSCGETGHVWGRASGKSLYLPVSFAVILKML